MIGACRLVVGHRVTLFAICVLPNQKFLDQGNTVGRLAHYLIFKQDVALALRI